MKGIHPQLEPIQKAVAAVVLALFLAACYFINYAGLLNCVNLHDYDLFFRLRGPRATASSIVIIAIDQRSLKQLGDWPMARHYYAELLDRLPRSCTVGLDVIFAERHQGDERLQQAIRDQGRVVLPLYIDPAHNVVEPNGFVPAAVGHVHVEPGIDGVLREVYHHLIVGGREYPSLALAVTGVWNGKSPPLPLPLPPASRPSSHAIFQRDPMWINYYGPPGTFPHVSFADALDANFPAAYFSHKIVLIGVTAPGIEGTLFTPFSQDRTGMHGVEVQAHIINNLLDGSAIRTLKSSWIVVLTLAASYLFFFAFFLVDAWTQMLIWFSTMSALAAISYILFSLRALWFPPAFSQACLTAAYGLAYVFRLRSLNQSYFEAKTDWEETFNSIQDAILIENRRGTWIRWNEKAERLMQTPFWNQIQKQLRRDTAILHGHGKGLCRADLPAPIAVPLVRQVTVEEQGKHYQSFSWPRCDKASRYYGMVHLIRDVTEEIVAEKERLELQEQLIHAQRMESIGTLAGTIAHDFNNIISVISGNAEMLYHQGGFDEKSVQRIRRILEAGSRAQKLTSQILAFSRESSPEDLAEPLDLAAVLTETVNLLKSALPANIKVEEQIDCTARVMLREVSAQQIIMNLATNAYHAMREQGGTLTCRLLDPAQLPDWEPPEGALENDLHVVLEVADTGHGIPETVLNRIFDPYFTTKEAGVGTGLGLAIVRRIVERARGSIQVKSRPGKGTTFRIIFPMCHSDNDDTSANQQRKANVG